jgi:hypothetical protein
MPFVFHSTAILMSNVFSIARQVARSLPPFEKEVKRRVRLKTGKLLTRVAGPGATFAVGACSGFSSGEGTCDAALPRPPGVSHNR